MQDDQPTDGGKGLLKEIAGFLWENKWWWIAPMVLMGLMFAFLLLSSDLTGDAPFIYTLF